tara:strand:- start:558 stop:683 length:126 start_codon:yes stop_codon:yes gene_type:complete
MNISDKRISTIKGKPNDEIKRNIMINKNNLITINLNIFYLN